MQVICISLLNYINRVEFDSCSVKTLKKKKNCIRTTFLYATIIYYTPLYKCSLCKYIRDDSREREIRFVILHKYLSK